VGMELLLAVLISELSSCSCQLCADKSLPHSDLLFNMEVRGHDPRGFGNIVMCLILMGRIGLCGCRHLWTLLSLQIRTFLDIKCLLSAWVAVASFNSSSVTTCLRLSLCI
jgi:hypothetical protein